MADPNTNNGNEQITLKDSNGNVVVVSRGSNDTSSAAYRQRTITFNGVMVASGAVSAGDGSSTGDESYLLPWLWDSSTGKLVKDSEQKLYHWNTKGGTTTWTLPDSWKNLSSVKVYQLTDQGKTNEQTVAVSGGKVTLTADAETPYVVYKGEAKQIQVNWSEGMHVVDAGFNGGSNTLTDNWTVSGSGKAEVEGDNNAMLRLTGKVDVSQRLTDLKAGQKYALYVGVDNRSTGDASVSTGSASAVVGRRHPPHGRCIRHRNQRRQGAGHQLHRQVHRQELHQGIRPQHEQQYGKWLQLLPEHVRVLHRA